MLSQPRVVTKADQPFAAIVLTVSQPEIASVAPPLIGEVMAWIAANGGEEAGPCFFNYVTFLPDGKMEMQVGVPTRTVMTGDGRVTTGTLPGGRYVSATLSGPYSALYNANMEVDKWARAQGLEFSGEERADRFLGATRLEIYHSEPDAEPPVTEVAFRVK